LQDAASVVVMKRGTATVSREELLNYAIWFALRGMGLTDKAIGTHFKPKALALSFAEN